MQEKLSIILLLAFYFVLNTILIKFFDLPSNFEVIDFYMKSISLASFVLIVFLAYFSRGKIIFILPCFLTMFFTWFYVIKNFSEIILGYVVIGVISSSMSPTINISDYIMYKKGRDIERNKIVRVRNIPSPDDSSFITVGKRIAAIPGDAVFVCDFEVYINEVSFYKNPKPMSECLHTENILIKNGEIYLLGDNKFDSYDSRYFGAVSIENVDGIALYKISADSKIAYL